MTDENGPKSERKEGPRKLRHELRTPLNQIIGFAAMLKEEAEDLGYEHFVGDLRKIEKAGWKLLGLVDELTANFDAFFPAPALQTRPEKPVNSLASSELVAKTPQKLLDVGDACEETRSFRAPTTSRKSSEGFARLGTSAKPSAPGPLSELLPSKLNTTVNQAAKVHQLKTGRRSILVVDDNPQNREMLARRLQQRAFDVDVAEGGAKALEMVERGDYDLLLLDVMMPEIDGLTVLTILREDYSPAQLPIIMATALDGSADVVEALKLGANDYVTKPLDFDIVLARVNTQLSLKEAHDHITHLNERLDHAQGQLLRFSDPAAAPDISAWAEPLCQEVGRMVNARHVTFWLLEDGELSAVGTPPNAPPRLVDVEFLGATGGHKFIPPDGALFAVAGLTGQLYGCLEVRGEKVRWRDHELHLVGQFARHLGGALELRRMQAELLDAEQRRREAQNELIDKGVELLRTCPICDRCYSHLVETCEADGVRLISPRVLPYRIMDRYRLVRILGEGGMGTVFEAVDERLGRSVAIKIIKSEHFDDNEILRRFEVEAKLVAKIQHPNVIAVFDSGELDDGAMFIVMEMLDGRDLGGILKAQGRGTAEQVASLISQAAAGLHAAHKTGLVHRDIKPENLFILPLDEGDFTVKVLDFGIAKELDKNVGLTQTGQLLGTPTYMSPEQIKNKKIDARSDIFSLAALAFEALSGRKITLATDIFAIVIDIVQEAPPALSSLVPELDDEVDLAFAKGLAKSPTDRPDTIDKWAQLLAAALRPIESTCEGWELLEEDEYSPLMPSIF